MTEPSRTRPGALLMLGELQTRNTRAKVTEFWHELLEAFLAPRCSGFGFSDIQSPPELEKFLCFADWQPKLLAKASIEFEWTVAASTRKSSRQSLAVFELCPQAVQRLLRTKFYSWTVTSDTYPADRLYFFDNSELLLEAEPYEGTLMFYGAPAEIDAALKEIELEAVEHLDRSRDWIVRSSLSPA